MAEGRITFPLPSGICAVVGFGLAAIGSFILAILLGTAWSFGLFLHLLLVALVGYMLAMRCTENGNELFGLVGLVYVPHKREELAGTIARLPDKAAEAARNAAEKVEHAITGNVAQEPASAAGGSGERVQVLGTRPPLLDTPPPRGDDLTMINGVGQKLAGVLNGLGVHHFSQIANWNENELAWVDRHLGSFRGRADRDDWIGQAAKLMRGAAPADEPRHESRDEPGHEGRARDEPGDERTSKGS